MILAFASCLDFEYFPQEYLPILDIRFDMIHGSDCFGLGLLTIVAIGQYKIKTSEHHHQHAAHHHHAHQQAAHSHGSLHPHNHDY